MVAALPNVMRNGTYTTEDLVMIIDSRTSACIPTLTEPPPDDDDPCYYQLSPECHIQITNSQALMY
jgi:hypothetical protein